MPFSSKFSLPSSFFLGLLPIHPRDIHLASIFFSGICAELASIGGRNPARRVKTPSQCRKEVPWKVESWRVSWCGKGPPIPPKANGNGVPNVPFFSNLLQKCIFWTSKSQDCRVTLKMKKKRSVKNSAVSIAEIPKHLQLGVLVYRWRGLDFSKANKHQWVGVQCFTQQEHQTN